MKLTKSLIAVLVVTFCACVVNAQQPQNEPEQRQSDSLQRIVMRDSLTVSDSVITRIFAIRNEYFQEVQNTRSDAQASKAQRDSTIASIREQTNRSIKELLGIEAYEKYLRMIRNNMRKRNSGNGQPLTIDNK
jgi:hypothetical protein